MLKHPAQPTKLRLKLNLLYPQGISEKLPVKFIKWLLAYGRFIVIAVEILVVAAFIFRFKLDADLDELKHKINNEIPYVEGLSVDEAIIRQTQTRLASIAKSNQDSKTWIDVIPRISQYVPERVRLLNFSIEKDANSKLSLKITGKSKSNSELSSFINSLKKDQRLKDINLANVTFDQGEIGFTITGVTK